MAVAAVKPVAIKINEDRKIHFNQPADSAKRAAQWKIPEDTKRFGDREEKREAFRQDRLQAWNAFRASGQHLTADQADAWMAQLEQGVDVDPPACQRSLT